MSCTDAVKHSIMGIDMRSLTRRRVASEEADSGEVSLNKLGYKQELSRGFGFINNAAMSFRCEHMPYLELGPVGAPSPAWQLRRL